MKLLATILLAGAVSAVQIRSNAGYDGCKWRLNTDCGDGSYIKDVCVNGRTDYGSTEMWYKASANAQEQLLEASEVY